MITAMKKTAKEMMNFKLAYHQSDEVSFLLLDTEEITSEPWFNNEVQKLASITASTFGAYFNESMGGTTAIFDARCFTLPLEEIPNVFIWRQRDWERNSLQMLSRSVYSSQELHGKKSQDMHEMLHAKGENWAKLEPVYKNGSFLLKDMTLLHERLNYEQIRTLY